MDIYKKYGVILDGKRRTYFCPLDKKTYDLEYTTPEHLKIGGEIIDGECSWGTLVTKTARYLLEIHEEYLSDILNFHTDWSTMPAFVDAPRFTYSEVVPGLYVNCNHTSIHSCWFIIDLLNYFEINISVCELLIHRMPKSEPEELQKYISNEVRNDFQNYLSRQKLFAHEKIDKIMKNTDYLNGVFKKRKSGYNDLFLFDDTRLFGSAKAKFLKEFAQLYPDYENGYVVAKHYLDYLTDFYSNSGYTYRRKEK